MKSLFMTITPVYIYLAPMIIGAFLLKDAKDINLLIYSFGIGIMSFMLLIYGRLSKGE